MQKTSFEHLGFTEARSLNHLLASHEDPLQSLGDVELHSEHTSQLLDLPDSASRALAKKGKKGWLAASGAAVLDSRLATAYFSYFIHTDPNALSAGSDKDATNRTG